MEVIMSTDWYPRSRDEQLHMVKTWNTVFADKGQAWGIPQARITQLAADEAAAQTTLDKVKSGEWTAASVVECNEASKEMETEARFIKKYFLLLPPLVPTPDWCTPRSELENNTNRFPKNGKTKW
jgi:hypothetical protein